MREEDIKQKLEAGIIVDRQEPFLEREFYPFMNGKWIGNAVSYGCYRKGQAPGVRGPSKEEILEDLTIVGRYWNLIRVYGSDNDAEKILQVIAENALPIKVMLGAWLENETDRPERKDDNIAQVIKAIQLGRKYHEQLAAISVGNETLVYWSHHRMESRDLVKYIRMLRANSSLPVTTADDYCYWNKIESRELADEVDFIVTHIYALWNGKTLENAIEWMENIYYQEIKHIHPDKFIAIGETGWATSYNPFMTGPGEQGSLIKGDVSVAAQGKYLQQLHQWIEKHQVTTFLFEAFDEPWKGGGDDSDHNEVEKHWGVFYENRQPKKSFKNLHSNNT